MKTFASKIFIDGGDPAETRKADAILKKAGYHGLDGQTTNPTLIAKKALESRETHETKKLTAQEALLFYRKTVEEISAVIPNGTVSIQVIGDPVTLTIQDMLAQARERIQWIPNGVIKLPCTTNGLAAAEIFCKEGPINITLNFSQEQAAGVWAATKTVGVSPKGAAYDVYISPFVGRLDDRGEKGMDVVANILEMYRLPTMPGHVKVLTASVRNIQHILYALWLKSDIITIPFGVFTEWAGSGFPSPGPDYFYNAPGLAEIPYREISLENDWKTYDLRHELTDTGLLRFWKDWTDVVG